MSTEVKPSDWDESDNRWEPTPGGGSGGVPAPTSEDFDKVLTVVHEEMTIVPEQTIAFSNGMGVPTDVAIAPSDMHVGDTGTFYYNDTAYPFTGVEMQGVVAYMYIEGEAPMLMFFHNNDRFGFGGPLVGKTTVSATVKITKATGAATAWKEASGGVYFAATEYDNGAYIATLPDTAYGSIVLALSDNDVYLAMLYVDNNGNGNVIAAGQNVTAQCVLGEITISIRSE